MGALGTCPVGPPLNRGLSTIEDIEKECGNITGINLDELFAEEFEETTVKVLKRAMETRTSKLKGTHPCP